MVTNRYLIFTTILLFLSIYIFGSTHFDIYIQEFFYSFDTKEWILNRDLQPYRFIFYDGIKKLLAIGALIILIVLIFFRKKQKIKEYKKGLVIVLLSLIIVPSLVGMLKSTTNMPCPKDEIYFDGDRPEINVWSKYEEPYKSMDKIACWPAGHASGGFALLSLFFLFKKRRNKILALVFGLSLGWSMGLYKMLIGDHFFSHTFITMLIAWWIILIINRLIFNRKL